MIICKTPLRISFVGGGSDIDYFYKKFEGKVISATLNKYIYVIVKERFDDKIIAYHAFREVVNSVDDIKHEIIREALRKTGIKKGIEIITPTDIPTEGSGLGSSSTVTVGLLNAFYAFKGEYVTKEQLAEEACEIEIEILNHPIGKQDQYAAAYGGLNQITFKKNGIVNINRLDFSSEQLRKLGSNILLFYTNINRDTNNILLEQKNNSNAKFDELRKVVSLVAPLKESLLMGDYDRLGITLSKNWQLKKLLASQISNSTIDKMYQTAINAGALGGKISGAGGGGFLMLYVQRHKQDDVRKALENYQELPFMLDPYGSRIIFNI
jgi:D-glycero-alpha-D-manno-heptose-7-phosphate kinase